MASSLGSRNGSWRVVEEFRDRLNARLAEAEAAEDHAAVARLTAMRRAVTASAVPLICPEAILLAGRAAEARFRGLGEEAWYGTECDDASDLAARRALDTAVRVLKAAGAWPWQVDAA